MHIIKRFVLERKNDFLRAAAIVLPVLAVVTLLSQTASAKTYVNDGGPIRVSAANVRTVPGQNAKESDTIQTRAGIGELSFRRSMTVKIDYLGEKMEVQSGGETVADLLQRLELTPGANEEVSEPLNAQVTDGMELKVYTLVRQEQTYTAVVEYETVYCTDASLPAGQEVVLTEGVDGEMVCEATVTYINGVETERTVLSERVTRQPVKRVVARGCAEEQETGEAVTYTVGDNTITLSTGEVLTYTDAKTFRASAYTHTDEGCDMTTATGTQVRWGTVAVDPKVVPYGTRMFIVSDDGYCVYGVATAEDCGGAIKGDRMDLYMPTYAECMDFGRRTCTVYILG